MPRDPAADPAVRTDPPPARRSRLLPAALVAIAIAAVAVWSATSTVVELETIAPSVAVGAVEVDISAGTIRLATGEELVVDVERRSGRFAGTPVVASDVVDGVLQVNGTCPSLGIGSCGTDVAITLPATTSVDVSTGAGSIDGTLANGTVRASTAAGPVALSLTGDVDELSIATGAGSIDLIVPDVAYDVSTHTGVGPTRVDVETAADARGSIDTRTEAGSITVRPEPDVLGGSASWPRPAEPVLATAAGAREVPSSAIPPQATLGDLGSLLDEVMADHLERFGLAGASIAVVHDGEVVVSEGYGYADVAAGTPVEADRTVFPTASVTKLFTWTAIMQLVEQGRLDLDAEVNRYLTGFQLPDRFDEPIRVWHLLSHTAGFEDQPMSLAVHPEDLTDLETALVRDLPSQDWEPGRSTGYNNYGAGLAGHLVAEVSGMSWEGHLDRTILEPLQMTRTSGTQPTPEHLPEGMIKVYTSVDGELLEADHEIVALAPFGGMVATSRDMASFMLAHLQGGSHGDGRILRAATTRQMHRQLFTHDPRLHGNAHGFWESTEHGQRVLSHLGNHNSSMTGLWLLPDHDLGVYVAYNSDRGGEARTELWDAVLDHVFPTEPAGPRPTVPDEATDLTSVEGTYGSSRISSTTPAKLYLLLGAMTVTVEDGDLVTDVVGHEPARWTATADGAFVSADGRSRLVVHDGGDQPPQLQIDGPSTGLWNPMAVWVATSWYDRPAVHGGLLVGSLLLLISGLVLWPAAAVAARRRGDPGPSGGTAARRWAAATGGLYLLFLVLLVASLLDLLALEFGASPMLVAALSVGIAAAVLTLGAVAHSVLAWRNGYWSLAGRIHYTSVAVAFVGLAWQLHHWNLLGFRV